MSEATLRPGHVAVITGAGSGIGAALAAAFGARDGRVVLADIEANAPAAVDSSLRASGVETLAVSTDVSDAEAVSRLARATLDRFGHVDVVCNNAGVSTFNRLSTLDTAREPSARGGRRVPRRR
jgi:NADP-dependent 3-hydroxy acid dehydrogenase YdfG